MGLKICDSQIADFSLLRVILETNCILNSKLIRFWCLFWDIVRFCISIGSNVMVENAKIFDFYFTRICKKRVWDHFRGQFGVLIGFRFSWDFGSQTFYVWPVDRKVFKSKFTKLWIFYLWLTFGGIFYDEKKILGFTTSCESDNLHHLLQIYG